MKRHKYGAQRSKCFGYKHNHRSKLEAGVCDLITAKEQKGELRRLGCEVSVRLSEAKIRYVADFHVRDRKTGEEFFIEAKGMETARWRVIKSLWSKYGPGRLDVYKGSSTRPMLAYTIEVEQ